MVAGRVIDTGPKWSKGGGNWIPVGAVLAISSGMLFNGYNSASGQAISAIVNCVLLIVLLVVAPLDACRMKRTVPVLVLIALASAWAVFASGFPVLGAGPGLPRPFTPDFLEIGVLSQIGGVAALYCGVMIAGRLRFRQRAIDWLIMVACLYLIFGLAIRAVGTDGLLSFWTVERDGRFQGTIGNVNVTAAVAGVIATLALSQLFLLLAQSSHHLLRRGLAIRAGLYCFGFLLALGTAFATASRFTNVLTMILLIVVGVLGGLRARHVLRPLLPILIPTGAVVLLLVARFTGLLVERLDTIWGGMGLRTMLWGHYHDVARLSPLYGYGWGSFPTINGHFPGTIQFAQAAWTVNSAHNILLQLWLNAGLPYLLLIVAAFLWGARQVGNGLAGKWTIDEIGLAAAIGLIIACSMIDILLDVPATITLALFIMGLLWGDAIVRSEVGIAAATGEPAQDERFVRR
ncbi:O-antigen ligase [Sphingomonas sp.]|uniref:O-antigen ligase family protein n=1 Tax=Sphingomonas sp. TaxID=28214 RepID=UPI0025CBA240|nr:O-antigen ligase family protein [Sphingomonas sp.]